MESMDFYGKTRLDMGQSSGARSHLLTKSMFCEFYDRLEMMVKFKLLQGYKKMVVKEPVRQSESDQAGSSAQ